jgi:hypothetical protein
VPAADPSRFDTAHTNTATAVAAGVAVGAAIGAAVAGAAGAEPVAGVAGELTAQRE